MRKRLSADISLYEQFGQTGSNCGSFPSKLTMFLPEQQTQPSKMYALKHLHLEAKTEIGTICMKPTLKKVHLVPRHFVNYALSLCLSCLLARSKLENLFLDTQTRTIQLTVRQKRSYRAATQRLSKKRTKKQCERNILESLSKSLVQKQPYPSQKILILKFVFLFLLFVAYHDPKKRYLLALPSKSTFLFF